MNLATILCVNIHFSINFIEMGIYFNNMTREHWRIQCHLYEINEKNVVKAQWKNWKLKGNILQMSENKSKMCLKLY